MRLRHVRRTLIATLTVAALAPSAASADTIAQMAQACPGADQVPTAATMKAARAATLCLLNRERTSRGLPQLRENARLRRAAKRHSMDMVAHRYFDHSSPTGTTTLVRAKTAGYLSHAQLLALGENIGTGSFTFGSPAAMVDAWMHSDGHRANILRRGFRDVGIGIALGTTDGDQGATYTTDFGRRK